MAAALSTAALRCAIILGARADLDIGELGGGDRQPGFRFLELGQQFRIVDLVQQLARGDILAALDRALADPAVDARRDVDAGRVRLALDEQRLRLHEIPERQANDRRDNERDDEGRPACDLRRSRNARRAVCQDGIGGRGSFIAHSPPDRRAGGNRHRRLLIVRVHLSLR